MAIEYLYGRQPVIESLRASRRAIRRIILADGIEDTGIVGEIRTTAEALGVRVDYARRVWLDARVEGANHQGVLLEAGPYPYVELDEALSAAERRREPPFLLLLDLLQDVQNVGTLLRAAEAVGVHGAVIQERRAASITPAVVSASSGAVEHFNVVRVTNLAQTMQALKQSDVWLAGLDQGPDAIRLDRASLDGALGLVVGSEGEGLRRLVRERCDFIVCLPMRGAVESLNAATAGSIALYAAWQARSFSGAR